MAEQLLAAFAAIASALFVTELADKDALLILTLASRRKAFPVFLAGSTAFIMTTALFVSVGSLIVAIVPLLWVKLAGGGFMIVYGLWEARGLVGQKAVEREEKAIEGKTDGWRAFLAMVAALALLDIAGDATEVLTIILVAQYSNLVLVFAGCCAGLVAATAAETILGNRIGRFLTPGRIRYLSIVVFLFIGSFIIISVAT